MSSAAPTSRDHAALMDQVYRGQRHIYDATRKFFLFGRDRLIAELGLRPGQAVLEVGCGTGRNLALIGRRWPGTALYGFDISREMLKNARAQLGQGARLVQGDATSFDAMRLFGRPGFDRVVLSFAASMIPDWQAALDQGMRALAPGGSLLVVDFGDLGGLPRPLRDALRAWLAHFHVTPRLDLADEASAQAARRGFVVQHARGPLGYYQLVTVTRPSSQPPPSSSRIRGDRRHGGV